ncbi:major facilitator superfamily domain-containing protein [Aspergillus ambiguus]|uniref:major facilitator superfamily domain-containing protein n=1 Tax=Aspergillus ambiguus TaxID=176160 RepID=UPI003CCD747F
MATVESPLLRSDPEQASSEGVRQPSSRQQRWIHLQSLSLKVLAVYWTFLIMGANDAAYGPLIPYFEAYYGISHTTVSFLFLSPVCGYMLAAILNNEIHVRLGRRGIACIHSLCHLLTFVVVTTHPPYPVLVVFLAIGGVGNGLADSGWNAWVGAMAKSNELLGVMHGLYGVGAMISPLIATVLVSKANAPWFRFYNILAVCAAIEAVVCLTAFWDSGPDNIQAGENTEESHRGGLRHALFHKPYAWVTWTCAIFLLVYMGIEVAIGGWTVTYMIRVRHGGPFASGMAVTGFWLGLTCGRILLGFVTSKLGQALAVTAYSLLVIIFGSAFWLLPSFYAAIIAVSLQGFFLGPLFPSIIVVVTKILPRALHVSSIGFASAVGGAGAAVLPFTVGAIAQAQGVEILPPFNLGLSSVLFVLWSCLARMLRNAEDG